MIALSTNNEQYNLVHASYRVGQQIQKYFKRYFSYILEYRLWHFFLFQIEIYRLNDWDYFSTKFGHISSERKVVIKCCCWCYSKHCCDDWWDLYKPVSRVKGHISNEGRILIKQEIGVRIKNRLLKTLNRHLRKNQRLLSEDLTRTWKLVNESWELSTRSQRIPAHHTKSVHDFCNENVAHFSLLFYTHHQV